MRENKLETFFQSGKPKIIATIFVIIIILIIGYNIYIFITKNPKADYAKLQKDCSTQATKFLNNLQSNISNIHYTYTSHYNFGLKKCYILIHGVGVANTGTSDRLVDVYNNKDIADCEFYTTAPDLNSCNYTGTKGTYNIGNFNNFIQSYLETDQ